MAHIARGWEACRGVTVSKDEPRVALVGIAKDEEKGISEWLAYYLQIGFDNIYVYDNESKDRTSEILARASDVANVKRIPWESVPGLSPQRAAYNDFISQRSSGYDWVAFFDLDEFLVLHPPHNLKYHLKNMPTEASAVGVNWLIFGSSGQLTSNYDSVLDTFKFGAKREFSRNRNIKTIVRPNRVKEMHVHMAFLNEGKYYHPNFKPMLIPEGKIDQSADRDHSIMQLNHYVTKSLEEWKTKIQRGRAAKRAGAKDQRRDRPEELFKRLDRNEVRYEDADSSILGHPLAKKIMEITKCD